MLVERETEQGPALVPVPVAPRPAAGPGRPRARGRYGPWKRRLDCLLAALLLAVSWPVILVCGVLIKLTSRGPVFYSQTRLGLGGRPFTLYKLRSMTHDCERLTGPRWAAVRDPRVTPVGRVLRKTHLDELPQLVNVLRGEMSLVGPRPERPEFVPQLERVIPRYRERLQVLPGVTGLAQVQLPPDTDLASVRRKLAYDLHYIDALGFWLDVRIVLATAGHVLGLPYGLVQRCFGMPGPEHVERAYEDVWPGGRNGNGRHG